MLLPLIAHSIQVPHCQFKARAHLEAVNKPIWRGHLATHTYKASTKAVLTSTILFLLVVKAEKCRKDQLVCYTYTPMRVHA